MVSVEFLVENIPFGRDNAVSREYLCAVCKMGDRSMRQIIQQARDAGHIIINNQNGKGYYRSDELDDIERQYRQNRSRALSILVQQKHLRRRLKEAGREV